MVWDASPSDDTPAVTGKGKVALQSATKRNPLSQENTPTSTYKMFNSHLHLDDGLWSQLVMSKVMVLPNSGSTPHSRRMQTANMQPSMSMYQLPDYH
jgi:hypothetical protein